jgi:exosome complex component RRP4
MSNDSHTPSIERGRDIVIPGECLGREHRPGWGAYQDGDSVYSKHLGIKSIRSGFMNIIPINGRYSPKAGDNVIGIVQDIGPSSWFVDINAAYPSPLHVNDTPWRVEFGDTASHLTLGDVALLKIKHVDETMFCQVTMKEQGLRKLANGQIIDMAPSKVPRIIGKGGSMINMLKERTGCRIYTGQNGRVWIDGAEKMMFLAIEAAEIIMRDTQTPGLTERVKQLLDKRLEADNGREL